MLCLFDKKKVAYIDYEKEYIVANKDEMERKWDQGGLYYILSIFMFFLFLLFSIFIASTLLTQWTSPDVSFFNNRKYHGRSLKEK